MNISGETITFLSESGGGYTADGRWIPPEVTNVDVPGCVIIPDGQAVTAGDTYMLAEKNVRVLVPGFIQVEEGSTVLIRGEEYIVSAPGFDHRSPFGTGRGGSEFKCERKITT